MIEIGSKILVLHDGIWFVGTTSSFKKIDGSIDALINGLIITCKKGFWQALSSTLTETQVVEEAIKFNITALVNNSVIRKYKNNPDGALDEIFFIESDAFDDYEDESYSDECDCDSCRAHRGEEV